MARVVVAGRRQDERGRAGRRVFFRDRDALALGDECRGGLRGAGARAAFAANAVRLQLHALAYNLGNFLRTLATPAPIKDWSLTSPKEKLIKIGAKGRLPDGRSRHPTANVPGNFADDRRAAAAATSASVRRSMVMHSRSTDGRTAPKCQEKPDQALDAIRGARNVGSHPHLPFGLPNNSENRYNSH